jgi:hypothetical protein
MTTPNHGARPANVPVSRLVARRLNRASHGGRAMRFPGDANPDRQQGEERREEHLDEHVWHLEDRRRHSRLGEELHTDEEEGVDPIGDR